jgi:hypothetical protein
MRRLLLWLFAILLPSAAAAQTVEERFAAAQSLFEKLIYLEQRFDKELQYLYADEARIYIIEVRGDSRFKTEMTGAELKVFIDSYLPNAAAVGEWYVYSNTSITPEGERMRILSSRTSQKTGDVFPYQILVGPGPGGQYLIYEEQSIVAPK